MPKLSSIFTGGLLKAEDIGTAKPRVTISQVELKKFDDGTKLVISFHGKDKQFVCNKTNAARIAEVVGSDDTDDWEGKSVVLGVRKVEFKGDLVPAIRVLLPDEAGSQQSAPKPAPSAKDPDWDVPSDSDIEF